MPLLAATVAAQNYTWTQLSPASSPPGRDNAAMAYDALQSQAVLFGGSASSGDLNDTWVWDGTTWTQKTPANSPPARTGAAMVFDAAHKQVVLFGGYGTDDLNDTWVWDGTNWTEKTPPNSPQARYSPGMVYDAAHSQVILFGGYSDGSGGAMGDTWVWDGTTWNQKTPQSSPTARSDLALVYDSAHSVVVLFRGGNEDTGVYFADTWTWDGANWTQQPSQLSPTARTDLAMAYNAAAREAVMFGGWDVNGNNLGDTWVWNGSNWSQVQTSPVPRGVAAIAYDSAHSQVVMFGGTDLVFFYGDTWVWGTASPGAMAQVASAGGWDTSLTLVNLSASPAPFQLSFFDNNGESLQFPFTFPQNPSAGSTNAAGFDESIVPNGLLIFDTTGPLAQTPAVGSSRLSTSGDIQAFSVFTYTPSGQAAVVPLETRNANSYLLPFDNTGTISTGLAISNISSSSTDVNVVIRDDTGKQIDTGKINLPAGGHNSFMLTDSSQGFPATAGIRGTAEFDTPSNGQISVLGLRANAIPNSSDFALTTIPVLANVTSIGGVFAHLASGGGWQTTFTLVNTGATPAYAVLSFYADDGSKPSLPMSFPQTDKTGTSSFYAETLAPGASLIVVVTDPGTSSPTTTGWAFLGMGWQIGGYAVFRYNPTGQEAVVPLETVQAPSYILAFDNTGSLQTGLAIAANSANPLSVPVILRDDSGNRIATGTINLPTRGHTSFMLTDAKLGWPITAGKRGTIEFDSDEIGGSIVPLGLRAASIPGGFTITTIPVMIP